MLVDSCFPFAAVAGCRLAAVDCCFAAVGCSFVSQETNLCAEPLSVGPRGRIMDGMRDLKDGKRPRVVVVGHRTEKKRANQRRRLVLKKRRFVFTVWNKGCQ